MENKRAAILALAIAAVVALAAGATYAAVGRPMTGSPDSNTGYAYGTGQSMMGGGAGGMMGGYGGYSGMMGSHGMMGNVNGSSSMYQYMEQYMGRYWNSTSIP